MCVKIWEMDRKRTKRTTKRYKEAQARKKKFIPSQETPVITGHPEYWFTVNAFPYDNIAALHFLVSPKKKKKLTPWEVGKMMRTAQALFNNAKIFQNINANRSVQYHDHIHITYPYYADEPEEDVQALWLKNIDVLTDKDRVRVLRAVRDIWGFSK